MKALVVATTLLIGVSACSSSSDSGPKAADPLCRFASPPLTSAAQARQMSADLKTALGPGNPIKVSNLAVSKAALALELAAGQVVPSGEPGVPDPGLAQANTAQATLASACA
jgi:hypothetical protein